MNMKKFALFGLFSLILSLQLAGCGGGGGGGGDAPPAQKTATITLGVMNTATLSTSITGIQVTVQLPSGVTVTTDAAGSEEISSATVLAGLNDAALLGPGRYSSSLNRVTFAVTNVAPGIALGDFARLTCNVASGTTLTEGNFTAVNTPLPDFQASGFDAGNTVDLTGETTSTLKVTFGY